ncbi:transposase family protein [Streptosporangium sp. NPDC049304]|uniref:transposase family protein n=1 Tax=Streptosporangium sp. NPDC049304 TaxID=3154830 RepID=UPI00341EF237
MLRSTHDLTAAKVWGILRELEKAGIVTLTDKGYQKGPRPPSSSLRTRAGTGRGPRKQANQSHAKFRGPGERANAQLKSWRILRNLRCSLSKAGRLVKAVAVLQNHRVAQCAQG